MLSRSELIAGLAVLLPVLAACAFVAWRVERRWIAAPAGAVRALALMVVFSGALIGVHLLPGVLGVLTPGAVLVTAAACAAIVAALPAAPSTAEGPAASGEDSPVGRLAVAVAVLVAGGAVALLRDVAAGPILDIDAMNYQVPVVARWLQGDSIWGLHQFIPDYSNATYPMHGNVLVAAVMLPFDSAFLAPLVTVPYWALSAVAVFALSREIGAPRSAAVLAGAALVALPVMVRTGLSGVQTDVPMLAFFGAGVLFLLRHARTDRTADLVLAGVGLGLAFGTKWYAVPAAALVVALWALARRRALLSDGARVSGALALVGGFWLLRNWVETGNPLFPQEIGPFDAPRDTLRELGGFTIAHYAFDFDVWNTYLRPAFAHSFAWTGAALAAGAVAAAARRPRGVVLVLLAGTALLAVLYAVTPYSAFGPEGRPLLAVASTRYGVPALVGAAVLTAWALGTVQGRWRTVAEVVLAVAILDGLRRAFGEVSAAKLIAGTLVSVAAVALFLPLRSRPRAQAAVLALAVVGGLVAVDTTRRWTNERRYAAFDPTLAWYERNAPAGSSVGVAGTWTISGVSPVLPAFGPRFENDVEFVGEFREDMMRSYEDPAAFRAALDGHDLLFVGRGAPPQPSAREEQWAEAVGWRQVAESERMVLLKAP